MLALRLAEMVWVDVLARATRLRVLGKPVASVRELQNVTFHLNCAPLRQRAVSNHVEVSERSRRHAKGSCHSLVAVRALALATTFSDEASSTNP